MRRHFLNVAIFAALASIALRLFIANAGTVAGKVGLVG